MASLALGTADVLNGHTVHLARCQIFMEFLVDAVELVAIAGGVAEIDLGGTMAVDAPAHAQLGELFYLIHFLDRTMAGLTFNTANFYVL